VYVGAVAILLLARTAAAKPLSADDIATLLASVSQKRVAALIDEKGISFEASATEKAKLRAARAGDEVIDAVDRAAVAAGRQPEAEHRATSEVPHGAAEASGKPTPASAKARTQAAKATQPKPATAKGQGPEGMVFVPGGPFVMGCNEQVDAECDEDEKPSRTVEVGPFWIDKTEVTVASYRRCVDAGRCSDIGLSTAFWDGKEQSSSSAQCNWGKAGRDDHPINCVSWDEAVAYCEVHGKRLPTEAEWEKAARGTDRRKYAWGNAGYAASGPVANIADAAAKATISGRDTGYSDGSAYTAPVGSFPAGASPYGALDMIGNVWEWVADPIKDGRGVRGGSWETRPRDARASNRYWATPTDRDPGNGFRCAQ
jgi:formylglycine-generating enzyme required for sulfatase activity